MLSHALLKPSGIVVEGGSNDLSRPGGAVLHNILHHGYPGRICVLNPYETEVQGLKTFSDASALPETECAIFAVSASKVMETAEILALQKKTRAFIVLSAGFGETGEQGKFLEEELTSLVKNVNGTLIGPNCTGVILPGFAATFAGPVPELDPAGADFVSGSGAVACFTLERAIPMGIRFSSVITVGNSPLCGVEEVLQHWDETFDGSGSRVKLIYMEQVRDPGLFMKHAASLVRKGCRIAAVKAGTTEAGSRAAMSHTGALAGPDMAIDALFRKCGITRCSGREEFVYTAGVMLHPEPSGRNMAVITHAGGPGVMATDAMTQAGLNIPEINSSAADELRSGLFPGSSVSNPVDFLGTGTAPQLATILDTVENECPEIDSSVVIFGTPGLTDVTPVYDLLSGLMKRLHKPVFPVLPSTMMAADAIRHFTASGRIFFPDEVLLAESLGRVLNTGRPHPVPEKKHKINLRVKKIIDAAQEGYLTAEAVRNILDAAGIPRVKEISVSSIDELGPAVELTGFPVAMKCSGLVHKSDAGGVRLNITSLHEAKSSFAELMSVKDTTGVILQEMAEGIELFIGAKRIAPYGHIILCGIGGIFVEILKDISAGIVPVSREEALDMIKQLRGYELIKGTRGKPGVNPESFAAIISAVSDLLSSAPEISELDINPLMGMGERIESVDCRILLHRP